MNHKPKEISFSKIKKKVSDLLHKLQLPFEKVLKTIVKSFDKIVKSYDNSCALAHPIAKSYNKIVNKTVIDCKKLFSNNKISKFVKAFHYFSIF